MGNQNLLEKFELFSEIELTLSSLFSLCSCFFSFRLHTTVVSTFIHKKEPLDVSVLKGIGFLIQRLIFSVVDC